MRTPALRDVWRSMAESPISTVSPGCGGRLAHQESQPVGLRLARPWTIAADDPVEVAQQLELVENPRGRRQGLVREHGKADGRSMQLLEHLRNTSIGARVPGESSIVNREEPLERLIDWNIQLRRSDDTLHERDGAAPDHARDLQFG